MKRILYTGLIVAVVAALAACAGSDIPDAKATAGRKPTVGETPSPDETVRGEDDPPVVTLELGTSLHEHRLSEGDELPANIVVPTTNLNAVPVTAALQAVLSGTDVSLSWDTGSMSSNLVTVMNLSGPLPKVVQRICSAGKVFCTYRNGSLELSQKDTFVVPLPPISKQVATSSNTNSGGGSTPTTPSVSSGSTFGSSSATSSANSMVDAIGQLVGGKVQVDEQGGNILYTTDVAGQERVSHYLDQLRNGRPLVVLQMYVWEVTLNKENSEGINWNKIDITKIGPGAAKLALAGTSAFTSIGQTSGSFSLGAITTGRINTNSLLTFLSTQGRVQTVSNPQVTFVSGGGADLKVGGKLRYISQVGQLVAATNTSGTVNPNTNSGIGSNTVSTDSIDTGLEIAVAGAYDNNVVFANMELSLTTLVSLNPTNSGSGTIDLPETTDEKINTVIRVRPGDNLVMAGFVTSSDNSSRQGVPLPGDARIPAYGDDTLQNRELVIIVKPSIVLFSDSAPKTELKKPDVSKPLPDAMLIDKDGAKPILLGSLPQEPLAPVPASAPVAVVAQAETKTKPDPAAQPISLAPAAADDTPVDRRMMQRGFSHAFDELLQPAAVNASANTYSSVPFAYGGEGQP